MIIIQFTGLSGSGKTTLANAMLQSLNEFGYDIEILDGDELRKTICKDLGFSASDRIENNKRISDLALQKLKQGKIVITATINPFEQSRNYLKTVSSNVYTVWMNASLESLIQRDTKGLYKLALHPATSETTINLSGINDPYEIPKNPDLIINTDKESVKESIKQLKDFIFSKLKKLNLT